LNLLKHQRQQFVDQVFASIVVRTHPLSRSCALFGVLLIYFCNQGILTSPPMAADAKPPSDTDQSDKRSPSKESHRPQRTPKVADYLRVFSYATKCDFFIYALAYSRPLTNYASCHWFNRPWSKWSLLPAKSKPAPR
jgi:hypothetical protein